MSYGASHGVSEERRAQEGGLASTQESESRSARAARGECVPGHKVSLSIPAATVGIVPCSRPALLSGRQRIVVNLRASRYSPMVGGYCMGDSASRGLNGMAIILPF